MKISTAVVADDALFMRKVMSEYLREAGVEVVGEACTGAEALARYRELRPDLITLDIVMPEVSGIDALRAILAEHPEATVMMCSAMGQQALIAEALGVGAKDFLVKPFQATHVAAAIQRLEGAA